MIELLSITYCLIPLFKNNFIILFEAFKAY